MPHDIDFNALERAERKALENPYVKEGEKQPKRPHKHKTLQGKIDQTEIDIVLLIDKFKCKTYSDCLSNPQILIRLMTLYVMRNKGNISTPDGEKIADKKFTKMCADYVKDKIDSKYRFWIEDILRALSTEMIDIYNSANAELEK